MAGVLTVVARIYPKAGPGERGREPARENGGRGAAARAGLPRLPAAPVDREPTVFYFYEQYRTDAAFEFHRTAPHLVGYRAEMKELVARPSEIELYRSLTA